MHICVAWGLTYYNKFLFVLTTNIRFQPDFTTHYNWFPWRRVMRRHVMMTWGPGHQIILPQSTFWEHYMTFQKAQQWRCAEIVRNHINGYRGLFTQMDDGARGFKVSFCCKYSNVNTHSHQTGGDENDGWETGCPKEIYPCLRPDCLWQGKG